jgi:hypothetical protein
MIGKSSIAIFDGKKTYFSSDYVSVSANKVRVVKVPAIHSFGFFSRLIVVQAKVLSGETSTAFQCELLMSSVPYFNAKDMEGEVTIGSGVPYINPDVFSVIPRQSAPADEVVYYSADGTVPFWNLDQEGFTAFKPYLYVVIKPGTNGTGVNQATSWYLQLATYDFQA